MTTIDELRVALCASIIGLAAVGSIKCGPPPACRVFGSRFGHYGFHVRVTFKEHRVDTVTGELFSYDEQGNEKVLWHRPLAYVPERVHVSDWGAVVAQNELCRADCRHALVAFGPKGDVLADYKLADLLTPEELARHWQVGEDQCLWDPRSVASFTPETFSIRLEWGKVISLDVRSGKVLDQ